MIVGKKMKKVVVGCFLFLGVIGWKKAKLMVLP